ncbi:MAG: homoserine dehydrogenase [Planctomycetota bacterium]|jgi:homoserine dehydrogenase
MAKCNVALYGCGTVGMGVAQMLLAQDALGERIGERIRLAYVVDQRLEEVRGALQPPEGLILTDDLDAPLADPEVDVVVELFGGTSVARMLAERAFEAGKDVVTANKALLAEHGQELFRLARRHGRAIAFEASVGGGIPVIAVLRSGLVGDRVESIYGIVNGTCNYVLTRMLERGIPYGQALAEAQEQGYAEADPRLDVDGVDSAHKLAVLARLAFGVDVQLASIPCEGISKVELRDLRYAHALGYTLKLLAIGIRRAGRFELRVHPALLHREHPVAAVGGPYNAVCIHGSHVGEIVLTGRGAGRRPTASAVVADITRIALGTYGAEFAELAQFGQVPEAELVPFGEVRTRYYFRLDCEDRPGVLAQVATVLGEEDISIASVRQQEVAAPGEQVVPVVFMTHRAREAAFQRALERIDRLHVVRAEGTCMLRVEDI